MTIRGGRCGVVLPQIKYDISKQHTAISCRNSSLFERTVRITEKVRACTGLFHKTGGCWGLLLPSYVKIKRVRAGTFHMSPTALEISESNLAGVAVGNWLPRSLVCARDDKLL